MTALLSIAGRFLSAKVGLWLPVALGLALCLSYGLLRAEKRHSTKVEGRLKDETKAFDQFKADVRAKTALAQAQDAANAARVEAAQAQKGQQISEDYQTQLAALRARYDRLRAGKAGSDTRSGGNPAVPLVPNAPASTDGTTAPAPVNAFNAEANSIQLRALQSWVTGVSRGDGE